MLPFLIDVAGNAANLYDTIDWWDDLNHFVNWAILVAAFGQLLVRLPVGRWEAFGLAVGFGCVTAVLWEFAEYFTFIRNSPELRTAYTDTLGDLALGLAGLDPRRGADGDGALAGRKTSHIRHTRVTLPRAFARYRGHFPWVGGG